MTTALLLCSSLLLLGADDDVALKETGVSLPKKIGAFTFIERHDFEVKEAGYSLSYNSPASKVTIYVYNFGNDTIPDGKTSDLVDGQMVGAIDGIKIFEERGHWKDVAEMKGDLPMPKLVLQKFQAAGFTYSEKEKPCHGYAFVTAQGNHFLKIRVTQRVVDGKTDDKEVGEFLEAVAKKLK